MPLKRQFSIPKIIVGGWVVYFFSKQCITHKIRHYANRRHCRLIGMLSVCRWMSSFMSTVDTKHTHTHGQCHYLAYHPASDHSVQFSVNMTTMESTLKSWWNHYLSRSSMRVFVATVHGEGFVMSDKSVVGTRALACIYTHTHTHTHTHA